MEVQNLQEIIISLKNFLFSEDDEKNDKEYKLLQINLSGLA